MNGQFSNIRNLQEKNSLDEMQLKDVVFFLLKGDGGEKQGHDRGEESETGSVKIIRTVLHNFDIIELTLFSQMAPHSSQSKNLFTICCLITSPQLKWTFMLKKGG